MGAFNLVLEDGEEIEYDPEVSVAKPQRDRAWFKQIMFADSFSLPVLEMAAKSKQLQQCQDYYNHQRRHGSLNQTPWQKWQMLQAKTRTQQ